MVAFVGLFSRGSCNLFVSDCQIKDSAKGVLDIYAFRSASEISFPGDNVPKCPDHVSGIDPKINYSSKINYRAPCA
jgi:hypothetical protein